MDTSLLSFLTGYLQGKRQRRTEEEAERRLAEQQSVQLAQFLEAQKEREAQERYRQAQLEMGVRQLDISERHQAMLERHYELLHEIQRTQLELQKEENAMRREEHALRLSAFNLQLLENSINIFGTPEKAIEVLRKSPAPAVAQWASSIDPTDLKFIAKAKALPAVMNMVNSWNSDKMPSDKALQTLMKSYGLEGTFSLDEIKGLLLYRVENIKGTTALDISMFAKKKAIEFGYDAQLLKMRLGAEAHLQRISKEQDEKMRLLLGVSYLENPTQLVTAISSVPNAIDIPKALNDAEQDVTKLVMGIGLPSETAIFYTTVGLGVRVHTDRNVDAVTMNLWERRMKNPLYRRSVEKGATALFIAKYGRPPKGNELDKYIQNTILNATKDAEVAKLLTYQIRTGTTPSAIKSAK